MAKRWRPSAASPDLVQALGADVDGVIARRFRLTESQVRYLRRLHHIAAYRRPDPSAQQRELVIANLRVGATLGFTARVLDLSVATVRAIARAHGWAAELDRPPPAASA